MSQQQPTTEEIQEVYRLSLAARDFEINQLVQRNNFFMLFQGVLLAGLLQASGSGNIIPVVSFLICSIGFLISLLQLLMAAGAKFWQERWEHAVENAEKRLFPDPYPAPNAELFRVFSNPADRTNAIVSDRVRAKRFGFLVSQRFSPSRLPIYTALVFSIFWFFLLACTVRFSFSVPSWIVGFPK